METCSGKVQWKSAVRSAVDKCNGKVQWKSAVEKYNGKAQWKSAVETAVAVFVENWSCSLWKL